MKQSIFTIKENVALTSNVYKMFLEGDTSHITNCGQFVNIKLDGLFLRRPISVCDCEGDVLTLIYKVVGEGTEQMCKMKPGETLDVLTGLGNGYDLTKSGERPLLLGGGVGVPPMYMLCKKLVAEGKKPSVILGFNTKDEVFCKEEFAKLDVKVTVTTVDGTEGIKGFVADAMKDERTLGVIYGAHLEGPYLSPKQAGAQCPDFITPPDEKEYLPLLDAYADAIARWSYAPENDNGDFVRALVSHGVIPAAGHTDALGDDMKRAEEAGCHLVTHLYSCTSTITRDHGFRRLGVIEHAYLSDTMNVEIICDGKHLPPDLIRMIYKIKGSEHIALITDSLALAGTSLKEGRMQATEFIIEDGVCKLRDRSAFAGSIASADMLLRVAVCEAGLSLSEAVRMMTSTPARIMGIEGKGSLRAGYDADILVLSDDLRLKRVFKNGVSFTQS